MGKVRRFSLLGALLLVVVTACSGFPVPPPLQMTETPALRPSPTLAAGSPSVVAWTPQPTITPLPPDTGWISVHPGIEVRSMDVPAGQIAERVTVARLDTGAVSLRAVYTPGIAYPVNVWARQLGALLVVNGGYFTPENVVTGLTVVDGQLFGTPYGDYAGMLAVTPDGAASIRWLRMWPYDPTEPLQSAIQSFPILVKPGGTAGFPADGDDGSVSRRTVVAQDRQGRILLVIAPRGYLSLHALAVWLAESDLDLDIALNLDGGTSSGFWMADGSLAHGTQVESLIVVPVVLGVFAK